MWYVYVLYSSRDRKLYVGCTENVQRRLARHNAGAVPATRHRRPLTLIHFEEYTGKGNAFNRERFLKSLWGGRFKKKVLRTYLAKLAAR